MTRFAHTLLSLFGVLLACSFVIPAEGGKLKCARSPIHESHKNPLAFSWQYDILGQLDGIRYTPPAEPPGSLLETLLEAIFTKGKSLDTSELQRDKILANNETTVHLLLSMTESFGHEETKQQPKEKAHETAQVFFALANQDPSDGTWGRKLSNWRRRTDAWFRLYDSAKEEKVPLLPSSDIIGICRDPVNIPMILRRFTGVVGYTAILSMGSVIDQDKARSAPDSAKAKANVMESDELYFQWRCLWHALDYVKRNLFPKEEYAKGSVIDLAVRVLTEVRASRQMSITKSKTLLEDAKWLLKNLPYRVQFYDSVLEELKDKVPMSKDSMPARRVDSQFIILAQALGRIFKPAFPDVKYEKNTSSSPTPLRKTLQAISKAELKTTLGMDKSLRQKFTTAQKSYP